jgi:hypothetical protein
MVFHQANENRELMGIASLCNLTQPTVPDKQFQPTSCCGLGRFSGPIRLLLFKPALGLYHEKQFGSL